MIWFQNIAGDDNFNVFYSFWKSPFQSYSQLLSFFYGNKCTLYDIYTLYKVYEYIETTLYNKNGGIDGHWRRLLVEFYKATICRPICQ